jgi:hypothetical protein
MNSMGCVCGGELLPLVPTLDPPLVGNGGHTGYLQKLLPSAYVSCRVRVIQKSLCAAVPNPDAILYECRTQRCLGILLKLCESYNYC